MVGVRESVSGWIDILLQVGVQVTTLERRHDKFFLVLLQGSIPGREKIFFSCWKRPVFFAEVKVAGASKCPFISL